MAWSDVIAAHRLRIQDYCLSGRPRHVHSTRLELLSTLLGLCDIREGDWQHLPKSVFRLGVRYVSWLRGRTNLLNEPTGCVMTPQTSDIGRR